MGEENGLSASEHPFVRQSGQVVYTNE